MLRSGRNNTKTAGAHTRYLGLIEMAYKAWRWGNSWQKPTSAYMGAKDMEIDTTHPLRKMYMYVCNIHK